MRPIIIGAGRGKRLGPETEALPKTLVRVMGRPMLDWILEALTQAGFRPKDVVFISGYAEDVVRSRYPEFTYVRNADWANNNILLSLLCAREHLAEGFVSTYSDIVYEGAIVEKLCRSSHDLVLGCDTAWRRRYRHRTEHPETDAEKLRASGSRVLEISRHIPSDEAQGEFIGVLRASPTGGRRLLDAFDRARDACGGGLFREGRMFEKAYLIDLLEQMIEDGAEFHREDTNGGYMEIDTLEDLAMAAAWWHDRPPSRA
jgi:choline kinase